MWMRYAMECCCLLRFALVSYLLSLLGGICQKSESQRNYWIAWMTSNVHSFTSLIDDGRWMPTHHRITEN